MRRVVLLAFISLNLFASATLEQRVEELELNNLLNIFKYSAGLKSQSFVTESNSGNEATIHRFKLWLDNYVRASKNLRFYSRFEVFKYYNLVEAQNDITTSPFPYDAMRPAMPRNDRGVAVARAYLDYNVPNSSLVISLGRLPTLNGPPSHLYDGQSRLSTYPLLTFNGELDGLALSYDFWRSKSRLTSRLVYSPFSRIKFDDRNQIPIGTPSGGFGDKSSIDTTIAVQLEYEKRDIQSFFPHRLAILQYTKLHKMSFQDIDYQIVDPSGSGMFVSQPYLEFPDKMTDIDFLAFYGELNNIAKKGFNLNATLLLTHIYNRKLARFLGSARYGIMNDSTGSMYGWSALIGASQNLSFSSRRAPIVGFEYMNNVDEAISIFVYGTNDEITSFYTMPGYGLHFYYSHPLDKNLSLRVGYRHQERDHRAMDSKGTIGAMEAYRDTLRTYYLNVLFKI